MIKKTKVRSLLIGGLFTLFFVVLMMKLYWVQVVEASWLLDRAQQNWEENRVLQPKRGSILDRHDKILAQDAPAYTVTLNPRLIHEQKKEKEVVELLASLLNMTDGEKKEKLYKLVTAKKKDGEYYTGREIRNEGWKIDKETADKIKKMAKERKLSGIYLMEDSKRYYTNNELAAHVLGYTNKEGKPVTGLEAWYDKILKGNSGSISYETDRYGYELPDSKVKYLPAEDGKSVRLTIDLNIQHYIEQAMEKAYEKYKPKSMNVVAVDPKTLEILGLGNFPTYNPNKYWDFKDQGDFTDHAVSSTYEPGSTFKIVTLAGAVEERLFHPNDKYQSGSIKVGGRTMRDHNYIGWGRISYLEGLKRSSNVAFVKLGYEGLGEQKLRRYIDKFGFGSKTNVDLPGESKGIIDFHYASEVATATFGQGKVTVTAMQQVAAVAAVANGGNLMWPHIVKDIIDPETNKVVESIKPKTIRRVISEKTAREVSGYLEQVVSDEEIGTGRNAFIPGYRVAGKTGTAQKVINGEYSDDHYVISFIGYAPVEDPKILVCVIVDDPVIADYHEGGEVAAPVFKDIVSKSLRYMGVASKQKQGVHISGKDEKTEMPDLLNKTISDAKNKLAQRHLKYDIIGNGHKIMQQFPDAGTQIGIEQRIYLLTEDRSQLSVPDLKGKSMRDALEICGLLQLKCKVTGEGYVVSQSTSGSGTDLTVHLNLSPLGKAESAAGAGEQYQYGSGSS